jgi:predicted GNAT family N-acyltransferase
MGGERQVLHAQLPVRGFYEKLGFTAFGDVFDDAGILHISMEHFGDSEPLCQKSRKGILCESTNT